MRLNILFDANFMLIRNLYLLLREHRGSGFLSKEEDQLAFEKKTIDDVRQVVNMFPKSALVNCVWCIDSKSWRKTLIGASYKAKRKKPEDDNIDWESYRKVCDSIRNTLTECGITASKVDGAEADDLVFMWSKIFRDQGDSVVIVSGDNDLKQLVSTKSEDSVVCMFNPLSKSKTFSFQDFSPMNESDRDEIDDLFDRRGTNGYDQLISIAAKYVIEHIDPEWELMLKILTGDKSDNIQSIIQWKSASGDRTFSLTERMIEKAGVSSKAFPLVSDLLEDENELRVFCERLIQNSGSLDFPVSDAINNFRENSKIIWLSEHMIPSDLSVDVNLLSPGHIDITERRIESLRPELKINQKQKINIQSDIFSLLS
jgi:5'-3' exonuclease